MDRKSWLWKRKSFDKSPGETESSGSASSHSERLSDDQEQRLSPKHSQSPEVSSNLSSNAESIETIKSLATKLQAALLNIKAKEDLVKQHAKVAEEAVTGWEKAEKDALSAKQQLEAASQKSFALEDRVEHLDGALKECLRQLRQAKEEQNQKVQDAAAERVNDFASAKSSLESQISDLQSQLESARAVTGSLVSDLQLKLEAVEKENSALKQELQALTTKLKIRTVERDLSTQAAENASKQLLDSIKKTTKLDAECRRLRLVTRKMASFSYENPSVSSAYVDSFTDSHSDNGERLNLLNSGRKISYDLNECETSCSESWASALIAELDQFKNERANSKGIMANTEEIDLLDDFLEMEKLAALPVNGNGIAEFEYKEVMDHSQNENNNDLPLELKSLVARVAQLEEDLAKEVHEKDVLRMALSEIQDQLDTSKRKLTEAEEKLVELQKAANLATDAKIAAEIKANTENARRLMVVQELEEADAEIHALQERIKLLEFDIEEGKALSVNFKDECQRLREEVEKERALSLNFKDEWKRLQEEVEKERALSLNFKDEWKRLQEEVEKERALSLKFKNDCQHLQDEMVKEIALSVEKNARLQILDVEIEQLRASSADLKGKCEKLELENELEKVSKAEIKSRFLDLEITVEQERASLTESDSKIQILEVQLAKERAKSAAADSRCLALEKAISKKTQEASKQRSSISKGELKVKQEKELATAAGKLADCQKTIASLGRQLKSLASLDDLLLAPDIMSLNGDLY